MSGQKGSGRLPPRMHPDDLEAIGTRLTAELDQRTKYLREELEKLQRRTRQSELVVPISVHRELERRVMRLEDEVRDLHRASVKTFLELDDAGERSAELVQELREELTG